MMQVNYYGTLNVIEACQECGVERLVDCSSPSTRFDGRDIRGHMKRSNYLMAMIVTHTHTPRARCDAMRGGLTAASLLLLEAIFDILACAWLRSDGARA